MKPRSRIARVSKKRLAANGGRVPFSTIARSTKAIRQVNPIAKAKRQARNAKRMRSPEYKAARAGAMERAGGRCEFTHFEDVLHTEMRCTQTERLQFHELRYPKTRPLTADDGEMLCPHHHRLAESLKMHKWGKRAFA